ncbi:MAG: SdrD B-like domain-containing protein, partial [Chloroflexales bacterium]
MTHRRVYCCAPATSLALLLILATLVAPRPTPGHAQVVSGSGFASAVPCLSGTPTFATTSMANTILSSAQMAAPSNPALLQFTSGSSTSLAPIGSMATGGQNGPIANGMGATYGLAYDDGSVSGIRRLFAAAYVKRSVSLGVAGPGAIYEYRFATGAWGLAATVPGVGSVSRSAANTTDAAMSDQVGKVGLGDLEVSPDGRTLYAMNLNARQIARYDLSGGGLVAQPALSIPLGLISADAAVQADLRPFAIGFWPAYGPTGGGPPVLIVGLVDSAARSASGDDSRWTFPKAYVLYATLAGNGSWGISVAQNLATPGLQLRELGSSYLPDPPVPDTAQVSGWNPWFPLAVASISQIAGQGVRFPEPMLTDISFTQDGQTMYVGLRDRTGDQLFSKRPPPGEASVMSQGDVLTYKLVGGAWQIQGNTYGDTFDDNSHAYAGTIPAHIENMMGAASVSMRGTMSSGATPGGFSEQVMTTALLGAQSSGTRLYGSGGGGVIAQQTLIPSTAPAGGKATALGDVEFLCSYAFVGGRVWQDTDGNSVQSTGEPSFGGVTLEVFQGSSAGSPALASVTTSANGRYLFAVPPNTPVNIRIASGSRASLGAQGWRITAPNIGGSDTADSDISQTLGYIEMAGQSYGTVGGGLTGIAVPTLMNRSDQRNLDIGLTKAQAANTIGDRVWDDTNHDGLQTAGELGHAGIGVRLTPDPQNMAVLPGIYPQSVATDVNGRYLFVNLPPGRYRVTFGPPPAPFYATLRDVGANDAIDSDADATTGYASPWITLGATVAGATNTSIDLGLYGGTPDVWVSKTGPPQMLIGSTFAYTLSYGNAGALPAAGVQIRDLLPAGFSYISASPAPISVSGQTITWGLGALAAGQTGGISLIVRAPASLGAATSQPALNTASISTATPNDPPGNNSSSSSGTVVRPEVGIAKNAPAAALVGDELSYALSYANTGSIAAASVMIADALPTGVTLTRFIQNPGAACGYTAASRQVSCAFPSLAVNASGSVVFGAKADVSAPASVANTATISTATAGDSPTGNSSTATTAIQFPDPDVMLSISPSPFPVGTSGGIAAAYHNTGTGLARSAALSVALPASVSIGALPGGCT